MAVYSTKRRKIADALVEKLKEIKESDGLSNSGS